LSSAFACYFISFILLSSRRSFSFCFLSSPSVIMQFFTLLVSVLSASLLVAASPVPRAAISAKDVAAQVKSIVIQDALTIPANALAAIDAVASGAKLSAAQTKALQDCRNAAGANNTAAKANLGKNLAGNIVFDINKVALHACGGALGNGGDLTTLPNAVKNTNTELGRLNGAAPPSLKTLA